MLCIVKKTLKQIIESQNDYLVKVKANEPKLLNSIKQIICSSLPISQSTEQNRSRGRKENRITKIYYPASTIPEGWSGINRIICVERKFESRTKIHNTQSYYISSLKSNNAQLFSKGIRGHWLIENKLHWVKDVIQKEDTTRHRSGYGAENMSIIRNIAINIYRGNNHDSIKYATQFFSCKINKLIKLLLRT